jgi:very-short-patch-repair endonuclease
MAPRSIERSCISYIHTWSSKNALRPEEVAINTNKKYWFDCHTCKHDYEQAPASKTNMKQGCPYCTNQKLCGFLNCEFCLPKSCYRYKNTWSYKNELNPEKIAINSHKKYWFYCQVCNHEYEQIISSKSSKGAGCPYCSKTTGKICGNLNCGFCLLKSCYVYRYIWSSKNALFPEQVTISSGNKYWFECHICNHIYDQSPSKKTDGRGCPRCVNKTEKIVDDFLRDFDIKSSTQFKLNSSKRYDFCLTEYKLIIEIDGPQHFEQISNWGCPNKTLENDIQKMKVALENDYSVLRIYQPDIFKENIDWRQEILDNMYNRKIPNVNYVSSIPGIYDRHKLLFFTHE